jgi:hypothetical protein
MRLYDYHCPDGHKTEKLFLLSECPPPKFAECSVCKKEAEVQLFYAPKPVGTPNSSTTYSQGQ